MEQMIKPGLNIVRPSVIEALREATRSCHASLAASPSMSRLFDADYTIVEYRAHLSRLLGLFEPLERSVAYGRDLEAPGFSLRRSSDLRYDLRVMGATPTEMDRLERCPERPSIAGANLRGYNYVILGSMLGGKIIVRRLRAVLGPHASFRFYGDGNENYEQLWPSFCADIEEHWKNDTAAICAAALRTFEDYGAWLSQPLPRKSER
jgi:heme oxygenase (biliverdin-IX-beta and delta-forming)